MYDFFKKITVLVVVMIAGLAAAQESRAPREKGVARVEARLTSDGKTFTITERMAHYGIPGVSIAVVDENRIEWARAYGVLSRESQALVTTGSLFEAASTTKMLVAATAMILVQEGKLDLDTDVNGFLESWKVPENELTTEQKVTLGLLLSHRSGLPSTSYSYEDGKAPTLVQVLRGELPAQNEPALVETVPGSAWQYSNLGYSVIQLLLEERTGLPLPRLLQERLFEPLGMSSSTLSYPLNEEQQRHEALPHDKEGNVHEPAMHPTSLAQGGLMTTPSDLARFIIAMMRSYQGTSSLLLDQGTVKRMLHQELELDPALMGVPLGQGLGVFLSGEGEGLIFGHPGDNFPGATSWVSAMPRWGKGIVVMTNGALGNRLAMEILAAVAREYQWPEQP